MTKCNSCGGTTAFVSGNIVRCEYCGRLYSISNGELGSADSEKLYSNAVKMSESKDEESLKKAIEAFEALGSYKDSTVLADSCRGRIAQFRVQEEERRLSAEREAERERIENEKKIFEKKQKTKIKRIIVASVSAAAIVAVVISVLSNLNKSSAYNEALKLYNNGLYEEAMIAFDDLGDYSDAATYVLTIDAFLSERQKKYEKGISYYKNGAYKECITSLVDISDYIDSKDYIDKSTEVIYKQAIDYFNSGNYEKAKEELAVIPDNTCKDIEVELLLADIDEIIMEQINAANYEQAIEDYNNGEYETAQRLFVELGEYEDSKEYRETIGTFFYEEAQESYNAGNYVECGDKLEYIDSIEEWNGYSLASELLQQASTAYEEIVVFEAKSICRKEGTQAMMEFVDSKKCNLLSDEGGERIKIECDVKIVELFSMDPYTSGTHKLSGYTSVEDTLGNVYSEALLGASNKEGTWGVGECSLTFSIDKQYTCLFATVAVRKNTRGISDTAIGIIRIYGDDRLLWSDENIRKDTKPYDIEVDITGVTDLKIEMYGDENMGTNGIHTLLCEPKLSE